MKTPIRNIPGSGAALYIHGSPTLTTAALWSDASYKHGAMGLGVVLLRDTIKKTWTARCQESGSDSTEAELNALYFALKQAKIDGHTSVVLHCDSSMAIWHLSSNTGMYHVVPMLQKFIQQMDHVKIQWIARERNGEANALSRIAIQLPYSYAAGLALQKSTAISHYTPNWLPSM